MAQRVHKMTYSPEAAYLSIQPPNIVHPASGPNRDLIVALAESRARAEIASRFAVYGITFSGELEGSIQKGG